MAKLLTLNSHAAYARFLAEATDAGYAPRQIQVPSPYAYSTVDAIYHYRGRKVFVHEVSQRQYQVHELPCDVPVFNTDEEACTLFRQSYP